MKFTHALAAISVAVRRPGRRDRLNWGFAAEKLPEVCETHGPCILVLESERDEAVREYRERQQRIRPAESENAKAIREYRARQERVRRCQYDARGVSCQ